MAGHRDDGTRANDQAYHPNRRPVRTSQFEQFMSMYEAPEGTNITRYAPMASYQGVSPSDKKALMVQQHMFAGNANEIAHSTMREENEKRSAIQKSTPVKCKNCGKTTNEYDAETIHPQSLLYPEAGEMSHWSKIKNPKGSFKACPTCVKNAWDSSEAHEAHEDY